MNTIAMWMPGGTEAIVIGVVALLIFGRRLPEVARSVGKSIVEFKRGLRDVKDEIDHRAQLEDGKEPGSASEAKPRSESAPAAPQATSDSAS